MEPDLFFFFLHFVACSLPLSWLYSASCLLTWNRILFAWMSVSPAGSCNVHWFDGNVTLCLRVSHGYLRYLLCKCTEHVSRM